MRVEGIRTDEDLDAFVQEAIDKERNAGAPMFMGRPDRWFEAPLWRCRNGHVSKRFLRSEGANADLCLACGCRVRLTFPEDEERTP